MVEIYRSAKCYLSGTDLCFSVGAESILRNVTIALKSGEVCCLMGPSGSGKTTLLRLLAGLDLPTQGEVAVFETSLGKIKPIPLTYPSITVVFQHLFLWPHLTNRENVSLGLGQPYELEEFGELLEVHSFLDRYPNESSAGQQQRIALLRALVLKPRFLLLDEVTSALNLALRRKVAVLLKNLATSGVGILVVSHDSGFADSLDCTKLWMEEGNLSVRRKVKSRESEGTGCV